MALRAMTGMIRSPQFRESPETTNVHDGTALSVGALRRCVPEARQNAIKSGNRRMALSILGTGDRGSGIGDRVIVKALKAG
jgi:hypothetical protein